jgi:hypothetical protein
MSIRVNDNAERFFSFYRSFDELMGEYFRVRAIDLQRGRDLIYDFSDTQTVKSYVPDTFPYQDALTEIVNNFQEFSQKIDSGGSFKKSRIKLSEDKRFQFSFSLASKGLIRVPEYYNDDIAQKHPTLYNSFGMAADDPTMVAGVVDLNYVLSKPLANNSAYFYVIINGTEYPLRQQQKGTAKMFMLNPSATLAQTDDGNMYFAEPTFYAPANFSLVFSSTFKKSYLELPKKGGNARMVDLYIPYDMLGKPTENKITPAIPLLLAAEYFTRARIKVRINIMRPITIREYRPSPSSIVAITIKDFNKENKYKRNSQNVIAYAEELLYDDEIALQAEFGRYKNWMRKEVEEGRLKTPLVPKPLMLTYSTESLLGFPFNRQVASGTAIPNSLSQQTVDQANLLIKKNFNELIDVVDLYYNEKIGEVVTRIKKRFDAEGKTNRDLKDYFIKLLGKLYRDLEPSTGLYASSQEELDKSYAEYDDKLAKLKKEYERKGI